MIHSLLLVTALSMDSFFASLAYGARSIRIPLRAAIIISGIGTLFLCISLVGADLLQCWIPSQLCSSISFTIFLLLGISSLFQGTIKAFLKDRQSRKLTFAYSGFSFVLAVYADETKADRDASKHLSIKEACYLAVALSMDSLVSGLAYGISIHHPLLLLSVSFLAGWLFVSLGAWLGRRYERLTHWNYAWISGIMFLLLAVLRLL